MTRVVCLLAFLLSSLFAVVASAKYEPPPLQGHVVDGTGTLTQEQISAVDARLEAFRERTGFAIVIYATRSLEGLTIEDVAYETFNAWGVGEAGKDNGVLLVLAPSERRVRIETGKGVGGELTDLESAEILRKYVTPAMRAGDLASAVDGGASGIEAALADELAVSTKAPIARDSPLPVGATRWLALGGLIVLGLLAVIFPSFRMILFGVLQALIFSRGGGGRGYSGGGFGGGGYSGGGGRSGGGGASDGY